MRVELATLVDSPQGHAGGVPGPELAPLAVRHSPSDGRSHLLRQLGGSGRPPSGAEDLVRNGLATGRADPAGCPYVRAGHRDGDGRSGQSHHFE